MNTSRVSGEVGETIHNIVKNIIDGDKLYYTTTILK